MCLRLLDTNSACAKSVRRNEVKNDITHGAQDPLIFVDIDHTEIGRIDLLDPFIEPAAQLGISHFKMKRNHNIENDVCMGRTAYNTKIVKGQLLIEPVDDIGDLMAQLIDLRIIGDDRVHMDDSSRSMLSIRSCSSTKLPWALTSACREIIRRPGP